MNRFTFITGAAMLITAPVFAHDGPRIWIDDVGGKVTTFTSDDDLDPSFYTPSRVFDTELLNFGVYTTEFPGYEVLREAAHVSSGTVFGFNLLGPLLVYDAATSRFVQSEEKFGPPQPGPVPEMAVSIDETIRFTGERPVTGVNFFNYIGAGDHAHLAYTMAADGAPLDGPNGVYALPMQLTSSGLGNSDLYLLLLGKGVSPGSATFTSAHAIAKAMIDRPADANLDGIVNAADLGQIALHWQQDASWSEGDLNFDGVVDLRDLVIIATHWQEGAILSSPLPDATVPEPGALGLLGLAGAILRMQRRRTTRPI